LGACIITPGVPQTCYQKLQISLILVAKMVLLNFGSLTFAYTAALLAYLPQLSQLGFVKHAIQPPQL